MKNGTVRAFTKKSRTTGQKSMVRCAVDQKGPSRKTEGYGTARYGTLGYARVR
jgi:hypothetical protein